MNKNAVIVGTFVKKRNILSFMEMVKFKMRCDLNKVFVHEIDSNKTEYIVTFKTYDKDKLVGYLDNYSVMHVKNKCLFSINALNKIIESEKGDSDTPNNEIIIDWDKYKDKLIVLSNGELSVSNLVKIDDFSVFFKQQDIYRK